MCVLLLYVNDNYCNIKGSDTIMNSNEFPEFDEQTIKAVSGFSKELSKYQLTNQLSASIATLNSEMKNMHGMVMRNDESIKQIVSGLSVYNNIIEKNVGNTLKSFAELSAFYKEQYEQFQKSISGLSKITADVIGNMASVRVNSQFLEGTIKTYRNFGERIIWSIYPEDMDEDERDDAINTDNIILNEIYRPEPQDIKYNSKIIILPVNDSVLKFLSENPEEFYKLKPREFEEVMAEIYNRLGYDVELTKKTRDGGKDIILRKSDLVGDYIYYVECKQFSPNIAVGIGIVKEFLGTIVSDKPNGGIIATTSFFSRDAQQFVQEEKLNSQIQLHDFNRVQRLLNKSL